MVWLVLDCSESKITGQRGSSLLARNFFVFHVPFMTIRTFSQVYRSLLSRTKNAKDSKQFPIKLLQQKLPNFTNKTSQKQKRI